MNISRDVEDAVPYDISHTFRLVVGAATPTSHKHKIKQSIAKEQGVSLNGYTKQALQAKIKADTGKDIEL